MKMYLCLVSILLYSCGGKSSSKLAIKTANDTVWSVSMNNNVTQKTLKLNGRTIQELYYSNGKIDSFFVYDSLCGEYRELSGNAGNTVKYMGCRYSEDISQLSTIDTVYSFYLPEQKSKDSFEVTLWLPIEENKWYVYEIYRGVTEVLKISRNFPLIRIKLPYTTGKGESIYYLRKTIKDKKGISITEPLVLFKEINHTIQLVD
jgi:hypothetical protein